MDYLAIEMLPMNKFVKSVNKRIVEDQTFRKLFSVPNTTKEIKDLIRTYVISMLVEKYKLVDSGSYSDTQEQKNKKEESFQNKVNSLNESLDSI
jgi:Zn-dependent peptidase ImmA (M78 family)